MTTKFKIYEQTNDFFIFSKGINFSEDLHRYYMEKFVKIERVNLLTLTGIYKQTDIDTFKKLLALYNNLEPKIKYKLRKNCLIVTGKIEHEEKRIYTVLEKIL